MEYNFREIEKKWHQKWVENKTYKVVEDENKKKFYVLNMFPYPSGAGLHVGHPLGYIASDIYARYKRLNGFNVLDPMGYDAYGLPAEQYAIQTGQHPEITTVANINRYREQLDKIGFCFDWDREVRTCDPKYYHWTQWAFQKMFNSFFCNSCQKAQPIEKLIKRFEEKGSEGLNVAQNEQIDFTAEEWNSFDDVKKQQILMNYRIAYLGETMVNWCPGLGTVLANDEVVNGVSERGGYPVIQKKMQQWCLRTSAYSQRLLDGLNTIDWSDSIKETQSGQTTEETTAGTEETSEVPTQTEPTEGQSEIQGSEWVQFTTEDHEGSSDPEDKTRSYTYYYPTVTVTIPGNETVQMKIQKELDEYVDSFVEGIENGEFGTLYEDMPVYEQSYEDLTFRVIRADDKVISLSWGLEGYDQGAHGWYTLYYMNYYTQTGERITFDSLGSGFRDKALELVTAKAAEMQAKEDCFFNDYEKSIKLVVLDGTEDLNAIYQEIYGPDIAGTDNGPADPTFYITEDGFVFESGQYVLQSYAVGIVDFEIPAADFGDDLTADIF